MTIRRFVRCEAKGKLVSYIHGGSKVGVLVDLVGGDDQLGKDLAMHIAASKPKSWTLLVFPQNCSTLSVGLPLKRLAKLASRKPCWIRSLKVPFRNI
jgi:hypothetical protein